MEEVKVVKEGKSYRVLATKNTNKLSGVDVSVQRKHANGLGEVFWIDTGGWGAWDWGPVGMRNLMEDLFHGDL
jgi:hypothetical protein